MQHVKTECPNCKRKMDVIRHAFNPDLQPESGDISLCFGCGAALVIEPGFTFRVATQEYLAQLSKELQTEIAVGMASIAAYKRANKKPSKK